MRVDVQRVDDTGRDGRGVECSVVVTVQGAVDEARLGAVLDAVAHDAVARGELARDAVSVDGADEQHGVVLDLLGVRQLDASAAGLLAGADGRVRVIAPPGPVHDTLVHAGVRPLDVAPGPVAPVLPGLGLPGDRDVTVDTLLAACARLAPDSPERAELRRQAIEHAMPLAQRLARRFRHRGEPGEDLVQVAMVGLVIAIDGFDPARGGGFARYAKPTILGELRRYFRDKGWRIRVPRRLQELRARIIRARVELSQGQAATPSIADIAGHLAVPEAAVAEADEAAKVYQPLSLSAPSAGGGDYVDPLAEEDPAIEVVDDRESMRPLLANLPEREREILRMRFVRDMTQSQIADQLGISQMHVSRLLAQTLGSLRAALADA